MKSITHAYLERNSSTDMWGWRDVVEKNGIAVTLAVLGFPADPEAIYYNVHTGHEETLYDLTCYSITGPNKVSEYAYHLAIELEHWVPKTQDPNPVVARAAALKEKDVLDRVSRSFKHYADRCSKKQEFLYEVANMGGSMEDGMSSTGKGKVHVSLFDGREFRFSLSAVYDYLKLPRQEALF